MKKKAVISYVRAGKSYRLEIEGVKAIKAKEAEVRAMSGVKQFSTVWIVK